MPAWCSTKQVGEKVQFNAICYSGSAVSSGSSRAEEPTSDPSPRSAISALSRKTSNERSRGQGTAKAVGGDSSRSRYECAHLHTPLHRPAFTIGSSLASRPLTSRRFSRHFGRIPLGIAIRGQSIHPIFSEGKTSLRRSEALEKAGRESDALAVSSLSPHPHLTVIVLHRDFGSVELGEGATVDSRKSIKVRMATSSPRTSDCARSERQ